MSTPVRIIKHEAVPNCGSFEVRFGEDSIWFYWDDLASRRLRSDAMTREQALEAAREFALKERLKLLQGSSTRPRP
jgi:hypothetical protein